MQSNDIVSGWLTGADSVDGYENPAETIRRAIGIGVVGANVEDRLRPFDEAVARVQAIIGAAADEGIAFQLNARTDAIARGGDRPINDSIEDAIARGRAFLDAVASLVFVPGAMTREVIEPLVEPAMASASRQTRRLRCHSMRLMASPRTTIRLPSS